MPSADPPRFSTRWWRRVRRDRIVCPLRHPVRVAARSNEFLTLGCTKCPAYLGIWTLLEDRAFVAQITSAEYRVIEREKMTPTQVLEFLGLWPHCEAS